MQSNELNDDYAIRKGKLTWGDRFKIRTMVPVSVGHAVRCSIRPRGVAAVTER